MLRDGRGAAAAGALWATVLTLFVTWSVLAHGIPALRHDWRIPIAPAATGPWIQGFFQPWLDGGIGTAQPYPTFYWFGFVLWPLRWFASALPVLVVLVAGSTFLAASAALRIARNFNAPIGYGIAAATVATLNPWTYSKFVAGHTFMIAAYAILLALFAETTRRPPRTRALIVLGALAVTQLQFLVAAVIPYTIWCICRRRYVELLAFALSVLPLAVGITLRYAQVRDTPYTLAWQLSQSVPLQKGALLLGYTFGYAAGFEMLTPVLAVLGICALAGISLRRTNGAVLTAAAIAVLALVFASGLLGPIAPVYAWAVVHVPETGLYRELYDIIAFVGAAYVVGIAALGSRLRARGMQVAIICVSAVLGVPWAMRPVYTFFVPAKAIASTAFPQRPAQRVALYPAFQPLKWRGLGSGFDPDAFPQIGRSTPLNEFQPPFPANAALSYAWSSGDTQMLQALGVGVLISRPDYSTNWQSIAFETATLHQPKSLPRNQRLHPISIAATAYGRPGVTTDPQDLRSDSVFTADRLPNAYRVLNPIGGTSLDYQASWVSISLAALTHPEWSNAYGGVATASSVPYNLPPAKSLLAQVRGRLYDQNGRTVSVTTQKLRWVNLAPGVTAVRCAGSCALVLASREPVENTPSPTIAWSASSIHYLAPWAVTVDVPFSSEPRTLRFSETYTRYWTAITGSRTLKHVRLNSSLNGWILPAAVGGRIYVIELAALGQFACECIAIAGVCVLLFKRRSA